MPSFRFLPCILLLLFLHSAAAEAPAAAPRPRPLSRSVRVTAQNFAQFKQIFPPTPYFCFDPLTAPRRLGTVTRNVLRPGSTWNALSTSALERSISVLIRDLRRMEARGQSASRSYLSKSAKLQNLAVQLQFLQQLIAFCIVGPQPPAPTPTPTPTPPPAPTPAPGPTPPVDAGPGPFGGRAESLASYREELTEAEIEHLLNKVALGGTDELRVIGRTQGLTGLVNALVDGLGDASSELSFDQTVAYWVDRGFYRPEDDPGKVYWTLWAAQWGQFYRFLFARNPFKEYMTLLLSGQFATNLNAINFAFNEEAGEGIPEHIDRLRRHALGNFVYLSQEMVYDRAMSKWLNNDDNHVGAPNQNFAREFMELFTLGTLDPVTGAKNYDERSVVAATGYFSGFESQWPVDPATGREKLAIVYNEDLHDTTVRTAFPGVPGAEITGALDWMQFPVQILYYHPGSGRYIGERLFAQLVYPHVPESIVAELADDLRQNTYELKPVLRKILRSSAMFSAQAVKPCVASPVEYLTRLYRKLSTTPLPRDGEPGEQSTYLLWSLLENYRAMGQLPFEPPSVFGWKGACGINRAGAKSVGEGFLSAQKVLNRDRACVDLMNHMSWSGYDFTDLFPSRNITPQAAVDLLSQKLFFYSLSTAERDLLVRFLTHEVEEDGSKRLVDFDLNEYWYVQRKVPRVICLLQGLIENNLR